MNETTDTSVMILGTEATVCLKLPVEALTAKISPGLKCCLPPSYPHPIFSRQGGRARVKSTLTFPGLMALSHLTMLVTSSHHRGHSLQRPDGTL